MFNKWFATFTPYQQGLHARFTHIQEEYSILEVTAFDHTRPISFSIVVRLDPSTQEMNLSLAGHYFLSSLSTLSRVHVSLLLRELIAYLHTRMEQHPSFRLLVVTGAWLHMTDEVKGLLVDEQKLLANQTFSTVVRSHLSPFYAIIGALFLISIALISYACSDSSLLFGDTLYSYYWTFMTCFAFPICGYAGFQLIKVCYRIWNLSYTLSRKKKELQP